MVYHHLDETKNKDTAYFEIPMIYLFRSGIGREKARRAYTKRVFIGVVILTVLVIGITAITAYYVSGLKQMREIRVGEVK